MASPSPGNPATWRMRRPVTAPVIRRIGRFAGIRGMRRQQCRQQIGIRIICGQCAFTVSRGFCGRLRFGLGRWRVLIGVQCRFGDKLGRFRAALSRIVRFRRIAGRCRCGGMRLAGRRFGEGLGGRRRLLGGLVGCALLVGFHIDDRGGGRRRAGRLGNHGHGRRFRHRRGRLGARLDSRGGLLRDRPGCRLARWAEHEPSSDPRHQHGDGCRDAIAAPLLLRGLARRTDPAFQAGQDACVSVLVGLGLGFEERRGPFRFQIAVITHTGPELK